MNAKKSVGMIAAGLLVCAALVFNFVIFPKVLAASPSNRDIETITQETTLLSMPALQQSESEPPEDEALPNINAITKEQAIDIATEAIPVQYYRVHPITGVKEFDNVIGYEYKGSYQSITTEFYDARYLEGTTPAEDSAWFVLFSSRTVGEKYEYIPEGYTAEAYLEAHRSANADWSSSLGTDDEGTPVVVLSYDWTTYIIVEVNAFTGEYVDWGTVGAKGSGVEKAFYGDDLRKNIVREIIPEPEPTN